MASVRKGAFIREGRLFQTLHHTRAFNGQEAFIREVAFIR